MSGSVINQVLNNTAPRTPEVGMGVTICGWTDRHVGTIKYVAFLDAEAVSIVFTEDVVTGDKTKPCVMGHQDWVCTPQPEGAEIHAIKHRDGRWRIAHRTKTGKLSVTKKSQVVLVGRKDYYYDWSF